MKKPYYQYVKNTDRKYCDYYRRHGFFFISKNPGCFTSVKLYKHSGQNNYMSMWGNKLLN